MTNEEAIFCEKSYLGETNCVDCKYYGTDTCKSRESHKMAIAALKAQPCEDCVSREAVLSALSELTHEYKTKEQRARTGGIAACQVIVRELPPVTPKQRTGKWIKEETIYGWDGKSYQCSACGRSIHLDTKMEDLRDYPYCHCGAKMEGESEC